MTQTVILVEVVNLLIVLLQFYQKHFTLRLKGFKKFWGYA